MTHADLLAAIARREREVVRLRADVEAMRADLDSLRDAAGGMRYHMALLGEDWGPSVPGTVQVRPGVYVTLKSTSAFSRSR